MKMLEKMSEYGYAQKFIVKKDGAEEIEFGNSLQAMVVAGIVYDEDDPEILSAEENGDVVEITLPVETKLHLSWGKTNGVEVEQDW